MLRDDLRAALQDVPLIDIHSHMPRWHMVPRSSADVIFYHMLQYPLRSAGCAPETLWTKHRGIHGDGRPLEAWDQVGRYVMPTAFGRILRTILHDLYGFDEELSLDSAERLQAAFAETTAQDDWVETVLRKANIVGILSSAERRRKHGEDAPPEQPERDDCPAGVTFVQTLERNPMSGAWEHHDWTRRLQKLGKWMDTEVNDLESFRASVQSYFDKFVDFNGRRLLVKWISALCDFTPVDDAVLDAILRKGAGGERLDQAEIALLDAELNRQTLRVVKDRIGIFQFCYGTQFLNGDFPHPVQRAAPMMASSMAHLFNEFPDIHFNVLNGCEADEPVWAAMVQAYANVSLGGFWWQMFYPSPMHQAWHRRLDYCPTNRLMAFFTDGYCIDWQYGRAWMTREVLANVFAERIERGYCSRDEALAVAREIMHDTPRRLMLDA